MEARSCVRDLELHCSYAFDWMPSPDINNGDVLAGTLPWDWRNETKEIRCPASCHHQKQQQQWQQLRESGRKQPAVREDERKGKALRCSTRLTARVPLHRPTICISWRPQQTGAEGVLTGGAACFHTGRGIPKTAGPFCSWVIPSFLPASFRLCFIAAVRFVYLCVKC